MRLSILFFAIGRSESKSSRHLPMIRTWLPKLTSLRLAIFLGLWATMATTQIVHAQTDSSNCGSLANAYGPFDYRTERTHKLQVVEAYHFTPEVEGLIKGSSGSVGNDLDYTLRASPNHHRALMAMAKLSDKLKTPEPPGSHYSIECWFNRAMRFQPDDSIVRLIYASYLASHDRKSDANAQLEIASSMAGDNVDNAFTHFNIGLIYFDLKEYERALVQAHKAAALGFQRTTLRDLLQQAGHWKEPASTAASPIDTKPTP